MRIQTSSEWQPKRPHAEVSASAPPYRCIARKRAWLTICSADAALMSFEVGSQKQKRPLLRRSARSSAGASTCSAEDPLRDPLATGALSPPGACAPRGDASCTPLAACWIMRGTNSSCTNSGESASQSSWRAPRRTRSSCPCVSTLSSATGAGQPGTLPLRAGLSTASSRRVAIEPMRFGTAGSRSFMVPLPGANGMLVLVSVAKGVRPSLAPTGTKSGTSASESAQPALNIASPGVPSLASCPKMRAASCAASGFSERPGTTRI
eukprot:3693314-Prymnesium_polylepis.1